MAQRDRFLEGPVPGMALTAEPGSQPHDREPMFTDLDKAMEFLFNQLASPQMMAELAEFLKMGAPANKVAATIVMQGFADGRWRPELGMLLMPLVTELIAVIGKSQGIKVTLDDPSRKEGNTFNLLNQAKIADEELNIKTPLGEPVVAQEEGFLPVPGEV